MLLNLSLRLGRRLLRLSDSGSDDGDAAWLARFHAGDRDVIAACYQNHFATVERIALRYLPDYDAEAVIHDCFVRLLQSRQTREGFRGGSLAAWLTTVVRNACIDRLRAMRPTQRLRDDDMLTDRSGEPDYDARQAAERFAKQLPDKLRCVFKARFVDQRTQREAARALGLTRSALVYREEQVRERLQRFVLQEM
jgi:RNA polymerase sigma-70 factor (ECF subfamily)